MRIVYAIDGAIVPAEQAVLPVTDPAVTVGWAVFETMTAEGGELPRLDAHLDRLDVSLASACLPPEPRARLVAELRAVAVAHGGPCRVRLTITGGGHRLIVAEDPESGRRFRPVRAARGPHRDEPFLGGSTKHTSRAPWIVAVKRSGLDEVLLVDDRGRFTEGTTCGILAVVDGVLVTAPHDGRILPSTTMNELLERAEALGLPVRREGPRAAGPWDALYVVSTTRVLAPVVELDGEVLAGWDPIGRRLAGLDDDGGGGV